MLLSFIVVGKKKCCCSRLVIHCGAADAGFNTEEQTAKIRKSFVKDKANDLYFIDVTLTRKDVKYINSF